MSAVGKSLTLLSFLSGNFTWLPAYLKTEVLFLSKKKSTPIDKIVLRVPLERLDPQSQFGRLTLLRFEFFMSLINGKAKVNYLNFLLKKSPSDQKSLLQLIDAVAIPSEQPKLLEFTSNYRARRYREAFRVLDGKI